jgi:inhibitor of cysteine peptidase
LKTKILIAGIILTVLVLTLGACSGGSTPATGQPISRDGSVVVNCNAFQQQVKYASSVSMAADGTLTVTLCSNASTGFSWSENAQITDATVLQQKDHKYNAPQNSMPGAAGNETWTFKALKKGATRLSFEYSQPWAGGTKGTWTANVDVTVN